MSDDLGMIGKEDVTLDLKCHRIEKDNLHLRLLKNMIRDTMNPFDQELEPDHLYNIVIIEKNGETACDKFITECLAQPERFEQRIAQQ